MKMLMLFKSSSGNICKVMLEWSGNRYGASGTWQEPFTREDEEECGRALCSFIDQTFGGKSLLETMRAENAEEQYAKVAAFLMSPN